MECAGSSPGNFSRALSRSVVTMLIDIYMDGFSLHWRSAPLRHTVNHRVGAFVRVPGHRERRPHKLTIRHALNLEVSRVRAAELWHFLLAGHK